MKGAQFKIFFKFQYQASYRPDKMIKCLPWTILFGFLILIEAACKHPRENTPIYDIVQRKVNGKINTDSTTPPKVTFLRGIHAPKIISAGKPQIIQNPHADGLGNPEFIHYGIAQGLPLESITGGLKDHFGNLWFSSLDGVARYDGKKFQLFSSSNGIDNGISHIAEDAAGNLWFDVGDANVYRYNGIRFEEYSKIVGLSGAGIYCMYGDREGNMWFGTTKGLIEYGAVGISDSAKIKRYSTGNGLAGNDVISIFEDKAGLLWFGTGDGVSRFDGNHFISYTSADGLIRNEVQSIEQDGSGNMWFGTDSGASKFDGSHFSGFTQVQGLVSNSVSAIKKDNRDAIWIATDSGISKFETTATEPPFFTNYVVNDGLSDNNVLAIVEDDTGDLWFVTENAGVCRYNRNGISTYTSQLGLQGNGIKSIIQDRAGNYWFGAIGSGLSRYDGKNFFRYTEVQGLGGKSVFSLLQDSKGNIWVGCFGTISKFDGKSFTIFGGDQGVPFSQIWSILEDPTGNLWFTSFRGLLKYDGQSFTRYSTAQGLADNELIALIRDRNGKIWAGGNPLISFDGQHFTNYSVEAGPPLYENPALFQDKKGSIWIGSYGQGVQKLDSDKLTTYSTTEGLADNTVFSIKEDSIHHLLWFGTDAGLSILHENSGSDIKHDSTRFENFNPGTGYEVGDFSFNNSLFIDRQGVLWAGPGNKNVIRYDYKDRKYSNAPFRLELQNILINNENICWSLISERGQRKQREDSLALLNEMSITFGKWLSPQALQTMQGKFKGIEFDSISTFYPIPQNLRLPFQFNDISFEFAAIAPAYGSRVKYQYLLQGYGTDWSPMTNKTSASFGNIHEGDYVFRLKALNPYGVWSETSYSFTVLPPWYRTWWAYAVYVLVFLAALRMFSKWREGNLQKEKEMLEKRVDQRTVELKGTLENLRSTQTQLVQSEKMASLGELTAGIAHEIQNPLNFVNNFSEVNKELITEMKEELAKGNIEEVKSIANNLAENEDKILHHGKRADDIVKGMLQHSRSSSGKKEPTDINALADEYMRLAFHGLRAKDKSFQATLRTDFDNTIGKVNILPQEIGRVLLNVYNNAFFALSEKSKKMGEGFQPTLSVKTEKKGEKILITVRDNGIGIPQILINKIFQPFFTTKPSGQGTGLGLSISYDIIKAHNGEFKVQTTESEFSEFSIILPLK